MRNCHNKAFDNIVYEWEDELARQLNIPIVSPSKIHYRLNKTFNLLEDKLRLRTNPTSSGPHKLLFSMNALKRNTGQFGHGDIPAIIDYFLNDVDTKSFIESVRNLPLVLISSKEVYEKIIASGGSSNQFKHWPLSLPDKYAPDADQSFDKTYDIVLMGRTSNIIREYVDTYLQRHPNTNILVRKVENGHFNFYDKHGHKVCDADNRESYMDIMRRSKTIPYSTPGFHDDKSTNGFSQVTPRFLEALASGCMPLICYPDNADTRYYELSLFGDSINSYEEFENRLEYTLSHPMDMSFIRNYLSKHLTSVRAQHLKEIINGVK